MNKETFLQRVQTVQKNQNYDYSNIPLDFSTRDKICIICPKHGQFFQRVDIHLSGKGCPKCGHERTGLACRKANLDNETILKSHIKFPVLQKPQIPEKQYIIGTIYIFINKINNKAYVGQTYNSYLKRWASHRNAQDTYYFHTAIRKYGWDNFDKYVVEQTEPYLNTQDNIAQLNTWLDEREKYYIKLLNSCNNNFGYNLTSGGKDNYPEFQNIINKTSKKQIGKRVGQYDLEGNLIKIWDTVKQIYTSTDFKRDGIIDCCKGLRESYKSYIWKFMDTKKLDIEYTPITAPKAVLQYDLDGNFVNQFKSGTAVKKELGIDDSLVRSCCNRVYNTSKGFIWIFQNGEIKDKLPLEELEVRHLDKRLIQKNLNNKIIKIWKNAEEAARELNLNRVGISKCARGGSKTSQGYIWENTTLRELQKITQGLQV